MGAKVSPIHRKKFGPGYRALAHIKQHFPNVTSVCDAKKNASIEVTGRDVSTSKRKKHAECAMAVACKRKFELDGVLISRSVAYLIKDNKATRYDVPSSVSREVVSFDRGAGFEQGEYELSTPSKTFEDAITASRAGGDNKSSSGVKRFRHITSNVRAALGSDKES